MESQTLYALKEVGLLNKEILSLNDMHRLLDHLGFGGISNERTTVILKNVHKDGKF